MPKKVSFVHHLLLLQHSRKIWHNYFNKNKRHINTIIQTHTVSTESVVYYYHVWEKNDLWGKKRAHKLLTITLFMSGDTFTQCTSRGDTSAQRCSPAYFVLSSCSFSLIYYSHRRPLPFRYSPTCFFLTVNKCQDNCFAPYYLCSYMYLLFLSRVQVISSPLMKLLRFFLYPRFSCKMIVHTDGE